MRFRFDLNHELRWALQQVGKTRILVESARQCVMRSGLSDFDATHQLIDATHELSAAATLPTYSSISHSYFLLRLKAEASAKYTD